MRTLLRPLTRSRVNQLNPPRVTARDVLRQCKRDVAGKEVQCAATYSYTWAADQVGHVGVGLLLNVLVTFFAELFLLQSDLSRLLGLAAPIVITSFWEIRSYRQSVGQAKGPFPIDSTLLRWNAVTAAAYMAMGAIVGFGFRLSGAWPIEIFLGVVCAAGLLAVPWLRQKIIWQKAGLPYLFRLADAKESSVGPEEANALQKLIRDGAPRGGAAAGDAPSSRQILIGGPVGAGRTSLATGIGTEFAFKSNKVRYIGFHELLEIAAMARPEAAELQAYKRDGPANIQYWPWDEAQVLIIDDIGPVIASGNWKSPFEHFQSLLQKELKDIAQALARPHSIWIVGTSGIERTSISAETLLSYANAIKKYCGTTQLPLIVELPGPARR